MPAPFLWHHKYKLRPLLWVSKNRKSPALAGHSFFFLGVMCVTCNRPISVNLPECDTDAPELFRQWLRPSGCQYWPVASVEAQGQIPSAVIAGTVSVNAHLASPDGGCQCRQTDGNSNSIAIYFFVARPFDDTFAGAGSERLTATGNDGAVMAGGSRTADT
jgi:hypothetical protein